MALAVAALAVDERLSDDVALPLNVASTAESARSVLSTVASATMTFAGIAFSVVLLVFQMSSSEYSPRVIHGLFRDGFNKRIIGLVIGTFTYCLVTLRSVHGPVEGGAGATVPTVSVSVAVVLGVVAVLAIVGFIDHNAHRLDVSRILADVTDSTKAAAGRRWWPEALAQTDEHEAAPGAAPTQHERIERTERTTLTAGHGGWVQQVDVARILEALPPRSTFVLGTRPGRYAVAGSPLGEVRRPIDDRRRIGAGAGSDGTEADDGRALDDGVEEAVRAAVLLGPSRTLTQDPDYGIRQMADVALRALSPGVNDPTTAQDAIFHLADALRELLTADRPPDRFADEHGRVVVLRSRTDAELLELAFGEVRRAAATQPAVTGYLLAALATLVPVDDDADGARGASITQALRHQAGLAVDEAERAGIADHDRRALAAALARLGHR